MFKWLFHILIFAKYQNKEKPLKRQRKFGLAWFILYFIWYKLKAGKCFRHITQANFTIFVFSLSDTSFII